MRVAGNGIIRIAKTRKAFTLIELIVVLALLGIVIAVGSSLLLFGNRTFKMSQEKSANQYNVRMPMDFISKEVRFANNVEILTDFPTAEPGFYDIYVDEGHLKYNKNGSSAMVPGTLDIVYDTFTVNKINSNTVEYRIGKSGYNEATQVSILNIGTTGITGSATGIGLRFSLGSVINSVPVTGIVVLVIFDSNSSDAPSPSTKSVSFGSAYGTLASTTRTGYTFNGWFTSASGGTEVTSGTIVANASAHTVYAQWTVNTYTIAFNSEGGSAVASIIQAYGTAVTAPANPTMTGYTFTGWRQAVPSTMPAFNQTITAQWTVNPTDISACGVTGLVVPVKNEIPVTTAVSKDPTIYTFTSITWSPTMSSGKFKTNTIYTATIVLKSKPGYRFPASGISNTSATVIGSGTISTGTTGGEYIAGNTLTFTVVFPSTN